MSQVVEQARQSAIQGKDRLLKTLSFVPEDKVKWSPSATAKSALRIAAHCAITNHAFATWIRGQKLSVSTVEEAIAFIDAEEKKITERDQAVRLIEESAKLVDSALGALTPDRIGTQVDTPFGPFPMTFIMFLPGLHMQNHASQIDYLQTIWGDMDDHM